MERNKSFMKVFVTFSIVILLMGFASAANAATLINPSQDDSISGSSYTLNATLDTNTLNRTLADFFYDDGTSNNTITAGVSNYSTLNFSTTFDTTSINDVQDLTFWVRVYNHTASVLNTTDLSTGVDVDNGNPSSSLSSSSFHDGFSVSTDEDYLVEIDADSTIGITNCTVYYTNTDDGSIVTDTIAASGNACSQTTNPSTVGLSEGERYNVLVAATDANNDQTNSSSRILNVLSSGGGPTSVTAPGEEVKEGVFERLNQRGRGLITALQNVPERVQDLLNRILNLFR